MPEYIQVCNRCGAQFKAEDRDRLAERIVEHVKDLHRETISKVDAISIIAHTFSPWSRLCTAG